VNRRAAETRGRKAEARAALWLRLFGWRVLARRVRVHGGEVDLVARRGRTVAFVEVKARATTDAAAMALDEYRLRRVAAAAEQLAARFMRDGDDLRIDAIFIVPGRLPRHLANVWLGDKIGHLA
jgi:putative endonuclease